MQSDGCMKEIGIDGFVSCPYNPAHQMLRSRLAIHLKKCEDGQKVQGIVPPVRMVQCAFNTSHMLPETQIKHHQSICEDRKTMELYVHTLDVNGKDQCNGDHPPSTYAPVESSDNWDDVSAVTYNPEKYVTENAIIRTKIGGPPSVRKEFRRNERVRHRELNQ